MKNLVLKSASLALALTLAMNNVTFGQQTQPKSEQTSDQPGERIFMVVEKQPEYPGGELERKKFFTQHLNIPQTDQKDRKTFVSFVVNTDGSLQDIAIRKGQGPEYDQEVLRVAKLMPKWTPGSQSGKLVRVKYMMPVVF